MKRSSLLRCAVVALAALLGGALLLVARDASADPSEDTGGVLRPAAQPGDDARRVLDALLFVPRTIVRIAVLASTATASFFEDQQIVPRSRKLLDSDDGTVRIIPTLSLASGLRPEAGARVSTRKHGFASMLRASIVNDSQYLAEGRLLQAFGKNDHDQLVLEGFQQRHASGYGGVGVRPSEDGRNSFLPGHAGGSASFLESRQRIIGAFGTRVEKDYELIVSSSFQRRKIEDAPDEADSIASTFKPSTVPGAYDRSERAYTELTIRRDTRAVRGPPAAGLLLEGYGGSSQDVNGKYAPALHAGGRAAAFIKVVRKTSIINPRVTLDVVSPLGNKGLPFREYAYASGFRGQYGNTDRVAALASIDYRWQLRTYVAARIFVDTTTVAPAVPRLSVEHLAWAAGIAVDLHSSETLIGRIGIVGSPQAVELILVFGLSDPGFGDRQHR